MPSDERAAEHRRINKPIMEKRRRARINDSLTQLKSLVLEGMRKDPARHSKLEKADILEMAVRHLRALQARPQRQERAAQSRYREGYGECRRAVSTFLNQGSMDEQLKQRLLTHLATGEQQPQQQQLSAGLAGLQLVTTSLPGGQIALLLPSAQPMLEATPAALPPISTSGSVGSMGSVGSVESVGSPSPVPSSHETEPAWDPTEARYPGSPSSSEGSLSYCEEPLDLVAHSRGVDDSHSTWRPW